MTATHIHSIENQTIQYMILFDKEIKSGDVHEHKSSTEN